MLKLWKYSTVIFVLQVVAGAVVYALNGNDVSIAVSAALTVAAFALTVAVAFAITTNVANAFAFAAVAGIAAAAIAVANATAACASAFAVVFAFVAVVALVMKDIGAREPHWKLWITALPLGIGTLGGGLLLLQARAKRA